MFANEQILHRPDIDPLAFNGLQTDYKRPDGNEARMRTAAAQIAEAKEKHFDSVYGNRQLYIHFVVVHPEQQRRGLGRMLMEGIIKSAAREEVPVALTLMGSPMGKGLYEKVGFKVVASSYLEHDEGGEGFPGYFMVLESQVYRES